MNERYSKLFELPACYYAESSPVIVEAGALYKDAKTGKCVAQLKMMNISDRTIKAVSVTIIPFDMAGRELDEKVQNRYLDLHANRNERFGQKQLIELADSTTRSFALNVNEVVFSDNSLWQGEESFEPMPAQKNAVDRFQDPEMVKQYHIQYGENAHIGQSFKDIWICSCGEINHMKDEQCRKCSKQRDDALQINEEELKAEAEKRLLQEKEALERQEAESERQRRKTKKARLVGVLAFLVICFLVVFLVIIPNTNRKTAHELCERGIDEMISRAWSAIDPYVTSSLDEVRESKKVTYTIEELKGSTFHFEGIVVVKGKAKLTINDIFSEQNGSLVLNTNPKQLVITIPFTADGTTTDGCTMRAGKVELNYE